jgi:hypothetical protein
MKEVPAASQLEFLSVCTAQADQCEEGCRYVPDEPVTGS